jgi:hypothetical protein
MNSRDPTLLLIGEETASLYARRSIGHCGSRCRIPLSWCSNPTSTTPWTAATSISAARVRALAAQRGQVWTWPVVRDAAARLRKATVSHAHFSDDDSPDVFVGGRPRVEEEKPAHITPFDGQLYRIH